MLTKTMIYIICTLAITIFCFFISCRGRTSNSTSDSSNSGKLRNGFVKKNDTLWFHELALESVDPHSFEIIDDYFFKDKDGVYFYETYRQSQDYYITKKKRVLPLEKADPVTFVSLGDGYAKDKDNAWHLNNTFKVVDKESLIVLNSHFLKDDKTAYLDRKSIVGSDGKTFELISDYYAKDAYKYYYCTPFDGSYDIKPIECEYESFVVIDHQYSKDKNNIFFDGNKLSNAESSSFELIADGYAKDKHRVYFRNVIVDKADPVSFATFTENENSMGETVYAKDRNAIYINEKQFTKADVTSFKILNEKYTMDKNGVYYQLQKVKNADPATFKVYPHFMGDADAEDKNYKYGEGKIVE